MSEQDKATYQHLVADYKRIVATGKPVPVTTQHSNTIVSDTNVRRMLVFSITLNFI